MMQHLSDLPVLSRIEYIEAVRTMPVVRRLAYALWVGLMSFVGLFAALCLAVWLAALGFGVVLGSPVTLANLIMLALPVICSFLVAMAFGQRMILESVASGTTFKSTLRRVLLSGLFTGFCSGLVFGGFWGFVVRMPGFYAQWLAPEYNIDLLALVQQIAISCLVMGLAIAPTFALFRAVTGTISHMILLRTLRRGKAGAAVTGGPGQNAVQIA